MKVYICSPYRGDKLQNSLTAKRMCRIAYLCGMRPIATHLFYPQFLDDEKPIERETAFAWAREELASCDLVWQLSGPISEGMAMEIAHAKKLGIPVVKISFVREMADV